MKYYNNKIAENSIEWWGVCVYEFLSFCIFDTHQERKCKLTRKHTISTKSNTSIKNVIQSYKFQIHNQAVFVIINKSTRIVLTGGLLRIWSCLSNSKSSSLLARTLLQLPWFLKPKNNTSNSSVTIPEAILA